MALGDAITLASRLLKLWDQAISWLRKSSGQVKVEAALDKADQTGDTSDIESAFGGNSDRK